MPNDALIETLEQLRDSYTQRQKAAGGAEAALKGIHSALNKADRALRTYAELSGALGGALDQSRQTLADSRLREQAIEPLLPELRRELKTRSVVVGALKDVIAALRAESTDVIRLGHALGSLQGLKIQDSEIGAVLPLLEAELDRAQQELGDTFGLALRHALRQQGIELGGRPPRFEVGRFEIAANFVSRSASIAYGKEIAVRRVSLSVDAVVKALQGAQKAITGRNEDPQRWLELLYTAWEAVRRKRGASEPRANIVECYMELIMLRQPKAFRVAPGKSTFADYSRAQFAYDFAEYTRQGYQHRGLRAFGLVATKSHADNPERSLWIVDGDSPYSGTFIGDIKFDRDE